MLDSLSHHRRFAVMFKFLFRENSLFAWLFRLLVIGAIALLAVSAIQVSSENFFKKQLEVTFFVDSLDQVNNPEVTCQVAPRLIYSVNETGIFRFKIVLDGKETLLDKKETITDPTAHGSIPLPVQNYAVGEHSAILSVNGVTKKVTFTVAHLNTPCPFTRRPTMR